MARMSLRHALFLGLSIFPLVIGYIFFMWNGSFSISLVILSLVSTIILGLMSDEKWIGVIFPILFVLFGIILNNLILALAFLLGGIGFALLFLLTQSQEKNQVRFSFFTVVRPGMKLFLLMAILAISLGIYARVPSQDIQETVLSGAEQIDKFDLQSIPLPESITKFLSETSQDIQQKASQELLPPLVEKIAEPRVSLECGKNAECKARILEEIQAELAPLLVQAQKNESESQFPIPFGEIQEQAKKFSQEKINQLGEKYNLSIIAAVLFLIIFLPFIGVLAWIISILCYGVFLILLKTNVIHTQKITVEKTIFT